MLKQLLFFFYNIFINISSVIEINIFLLPFYLYKNTTYINNSLFIIINFIFIMFFITNLQINNILLIKEECQKYNKLYFLSNFFYYISLLTTINTNILYINKIINLYNKISIFYIAIIIIFIMFLFILITNQSSSIKIAINIIKIFVILTIFYIFFTIKLTPNTTSIPINQNIIESFIILFFTFLNNTYITKNIYTKKNIINSENQSSIKNFIYKIITFLIINLIFIFFNLKTINLFPKKYFLGNITLSEILLKNYKTANIIHYLNVSIILISFFNIYKIILKSKKIIENMFKKTDRNYTVPEFIILFIIFFSILILGKLIINQNNNIILTIFFFTLSFIFYIINIMSNCKDKKNRYYLLINIFILAIINLISLNEYLLNIYYF